MMSNSMRVWMAAAFRTTVWSSENTANIPPRYQLLYTLVLPLKFLVVGSYGWLSVGHPISSIDLVFGPIYSTIWSASIGLTALAATLGVCFYARLIWVEAVALVFMVTLMVAYIGCIFAAAMTGAETFRTLSLLLVFASMPLPAWRVYDIVRELRPPRHV